MSQVVKSLPANLGDPRDVSSVPGWERYPGVGNGNPLQSSWLENSMIKKPGRLKSMRSQRVGHDPVHTHTHNKNKETHSILAIAFSTIQY